MHSSRMCTAHTLPLWGGESLTETPLDREPPVNRMTHRCKNITFPQQIELNRAKNAQYWGLKTWGHGGRATRPPGSAPDPLKQTYCDH